MSAQPFTWCGSSWSSFSLPQSAGCTCLCLVVCCTLAVCRHNTHRLSNTAPSRRNTACTTHRHEDAPSPQATRHAQRSPTHHHRRSNATALSEDRQTHTNTHTHMVDSVKLDVSMLPSFLLEPLHSLSANTHTYIQVWRHQTAVPHIFACHTSTLLAFQQKPAPPSFVCCMLHSSHPRQHSSDTVCSAHAPATPQI